MWDDLGYLHAAVIILVAIIVLQAFFNFEGERICRRLELYAFNLVNGTPEQKKAAYIKIKKLVRWLEEDF